MLAIKYYPQDCDELLSYTKQDYYWPKSSHFNYFEEPYIPPLREEAYIEQHIFHEENIEISEEIKEDIVIEEESKIKIAQEINENHLDKDLEVKMIEIIEEEIKDESFKHLNKSNHMIVNLKILLF